MPLQVLTGNGLHESADEDLSRRRGDRVAVWADPFAPVPEHRAVVSTAHGPADLVRLQHPEEREALETGTDPALITQGTAEVQARRAEAISQTRQIADQRPMNREEILGMLKPLGPMTDVFADADPHDKAEVYRKLGLTLTYEPAQQIVRVEAKLDPHELGI